MTISVFFFGVLAPEAGVGGEERPDSPERRRRAAPERPERERRTASRKLSSFRVLPSRGCGPSVRGYTGVPPTAPRWGLLENQPAASGWLREPLHRGLRRGCGF